MHTSISLGTCVEWSLRRGQERAPISDDDLLKVMCPQVPELVEAAAGKGKDRASSSSYLTIIEE